MSPEEARSAAKASFGNLPEAIEECYEARGVAWLDDLVQDLRYGQRTAMTLFTQTTYNLAGNDRWVLSDLFC